MRIHRTLVLTVALVAAGLGLSACSTAEPIAITAESVVVDVRTPEEFAAGHLEGAVNVNLQSGEFDSEIQQFDVDGSYVVYCQTGNRSAQAVDVMESAGFENVSDAGGVAEAAESTGLAIVTE